MIFFITSFGSYTSNYSAQLGMLYGDGTGKPVGQLSAAAMISVQGQLAKKIVKCEPSDWKDFLLKAVSGEPIKITCHFGPNQYGSPPENIADIEKQPAEVTDGADVKCWISPTSDRLPSQQWVQRPLQKPSSYG